MARQSSLEQKAHARKSARDPHHPLIGGPVIEADLVFGHRSFSPFEPAYVRWLRLESGILLTSTLGALARHAD